MPNLYFTVFELIIYLQFALCLRHALKSGTHNLLKLFFGAAFGVLLELATIRQLNAYHYGQFLIMIFDVRYVSAWRGAASFTAPWNFRTRAVCPISFVPFSMRCSP
jgi:hypothetical protein